MIYQSTTVISAGTNKRKVRNLMPAAGLPGRVQLIVYKMVYKNKKPFYVRAKKERKDVQTYTVVDQRQLQEK